MGQVKNDMGKSIVFVDVLIAIMIVLIAFLCSCTTQKKAVRYFDNHGFQAAQYCAGAFPVIPDTVFKRGTPVVKSDTTYLPGDSVPCPPGGKETVFIPCPPSPVIHDSVSLHDTLYIKQKDSAELAVLHATIERMRQDSIKTAVVSQSWEDKARNRGKVIWTAVVLIVLVGGGWLFLKGKMGVINSILNKLKP